MTLSFAPFYIFPAIVVSLGILLIQLRAAPNRKAGFWRAWAWGYGFFISGTYWISLSLLVDAERFAWLIPFALFGLTGLLAIFYGLVGLAFAAIKRGGNWHDVLLFTLLFSLSEFARGHLFTGFPWNVAGYASGAIYGIEQQASLFGVYGLGLLLTLWSVAWLCARRKWQLVLWVVVPIAFAIWGAVQTPLTYRNSGSVARVVQASVPQQMKWDPAHQQEIIGKYVRLSTRPGLERVDIVIWPETALPFVIYEDGFVPAPLYSFLKEGQLLLTGGTRAERGDDEVRFWNSLFVIDHTGKIVSHYDKHHLVPFGEYVPFSEYLPMEKIAPGFGEFSRGEAGALLSLGKLKQVVPLICYEVIFPHYAQTDPQANLILNVTNDAWFGKSIGPYQHEAIARMRAIEQNTPMLRVANTGISGYYLADGSAVHRTKLGETTTFDVVLNQNNVTHKLHAVNKWQIYMVFVILMFINFAALHIKLY